MNKQELRLFLIRRFLILMAVMYLSGELLNLFFNVAGFPLLYRLLSYLDIRFVSDGSVIADLLHLLCYFLADFLPGDLSQWVRQGMDSGAWGIQISVNTSYAGGISERLLRFGMLCVVFFLLELRMAPYLVGASFTAAWWRGR